MNSNGRRWVVALGFGMLAVTAAGAARPGGTTAYRFEAAPRAITAAAVPVASANPRLGQWGSGSLYLLALYGSPEHRQLGLAISHDAGDTFAPPVPVSAKSVPILADGEDSPSLAIGRHGGIYALWEQERSDGGTDLMFARSINDGRGFEKPIRVTDKARSSPNSFSTLGVAPDGSIYAVWLDGRDPMAGPHGTWAVYVARSSDGGATFGKNISVAPGACHCSRPALAFGRHGELFVAWRTVLLGNIRDIAVAVSSDQGETFGPQIRVARDNWRIDGCPNSGPSLAVKGSRLYVSWFSEGTGTNPGVRVAWSDDDGQNFAAPVIVSRSILDANHPALSVSPDGRLVLVFQGRDPLKQQGWAPPQAYLVEISDAGQASAPVPVSGRQKPATYPTVLAGTLGRVFVAWSEPGEKGSHVVLTRGRKGG